MSPADQRKLFEEFAACNGMHNLARSGDTYLHDPVHICWLTWQAAYAAASGVSLQEIGAIISAYGDPEAFGEREVSVTADIQKFPYRTKIYVLIKKD